MKAFNDRMKEELKLIKKIHSWIQEGKTTNEMVEQLSEHEKMLIKSSK